VGNIIKLKIGRTVFNTNLEVSDSHSLGLIGCFLLIPATCFTIRRYALYMNLTQLSSRTTAILEPVSSLPPNRVTDKSINSLNSDIH
jgi:hypothetical protein